MPDISTGHSALQLTSLKRRVALAASTEIIFVGSCQLITQPVGACMLGNEASIFEIASAFVRHVKPVSTAVACSEAQSLPPIA